jgi:FAD/FMN-containing dehydrogenase/Fe-S oxidoreductase
MTGTAEARTITPQTWATHQTGDHYSGQVDLAALEEDLKRNIRGEVRFRDGDRALYSTDGSNYRKVPIGVTIPRDAHDVVEIFKVCRKHGVPITARGGGTALAGQTTNTTVIVDYSKYMNNVIEIDAENKRARVQPGTILDHLRDSAEQYHLTFGPDPATHNHCTLGGMIGNNSCGIHSVMAGKTVDNIEELEILTYDGLRMRVGPTSEEELEQIIRAGGRKGEIYARMRALRDRYADQIRKKYPNIPRRVSGYNLDSLLPENGFNVARALVGSEGTLVTVLEATTKLVDSPQSRALVVLGYPNAYQAGDHVPEVLKFGPIGLEGIDHRLIDYMKKKGLNLADLKMLTKGGGWLLVEFGGDSIEEAEAKAKKLMEHLKKQDNAPHMELLDKPEQTQKIWEIRESGLGATAHVPDMPDTWPGWEDSAVPPDQVGGYLRDLRKLMEKYDYDASFYGHFGQGCLHMRIDFDLVTHDGIEKYRSFVGEAADLVLSYGGSLSGEHGDGQARAELLPKMFGSEIVHAFQEFKAIWDPQNKMNPGKIVDPNPITSNLRLGSDYRPIEPKTHFQYPEDSGSFAKATLRCVGVGKCRRTGGGVMCPSFMVTREEEHSTRGRSRLLFEMLEGDELTDVWRDDTVREALDLCLACKGCKGDCPVNVDMATYKAEFLSHYYSGRLRPITAYSMGLIMYWARIASKMPGLVNFMSQTPGISRLIKLAGGIAPQRRVPGFAPYTFKEWFQNRTPRNLGNEQVMLWPDTFNDHFHPKTAQAAVEVLESAGYHVIVPDQWLCCGRPFYDFGMLDLAKRHLNQILDALRPQLENGTPLVGLEPSCVSVFRDDMRNLMAHNPDAKRLYKQTFLLSEFIEAHADKFDLPKLDRKAIIQGHCHHKSVLKMDAELKLLDKMGVKYTLLDSGCCGMAGAFGFEAGEKYDVSIKAGERVLLPAVREADDDTLIIANGFSCREQIAQDTDRRALHLADVIKLAMDEGPNGPQHGKPEQGRAEEYRAPERTGLAVAGAAGAAVAAGAIGWAIKARRHP